MESLRGKLILAGPTLLDPNFRRTVVLIVEHTEDGAMGLVLNRPSTATVSDAVPDLDWLAESEERVYVGGPVAPNGVIVLAEWEDPQHAAVLVEDDNASHRDDITGGGFAAPVAQAVMEAALGVGSQGATH